MFTNRRPYGFRVVRHWWGWSTCRECRQQFKRGYAFEEKLWDHESWCSRALRQNGQPRYPSLYSEGCNCDANGGKVTVCNVCMPSRSDACYYALKTQGLVD